MLFRRAAACEVEVADDAGANGPPLTIRGVEVLAVATALRPGAVPVEPDESIDVNNAEAAA